MKYNQKTKIAVVGVSKNPQKYGYKIFKDLLDNSYNVTGLSRKGGEILGEKIYKSLLELDEKPELVIFVLRPNIGFLVLKQIQKLGISNVWLQPGASSEEMVDYSKENKINLVNNSCFMVEQGLW